MGQGTLLFPIFAACLSFLWIAHQGDLSIPQLQTQLEISGAMRVEEVVEFRIRIEPFHILDTIEIELSSEEFHELSLGSNLFLPKEEQGHFQMTPFRRDKDLSRTRQRFVLKRILPSQTNVGTLVYRSPLPQSALVYPFAIEFKNSSTVLARREVLIDALPSETVFVYCDWIEPKKSPRIACVGLDRRGNQTREPLEFAGAFSPTEKKQTYKFTKRLEIIPETKNPPLARFTYEYKGETFHSRALPDPQRPVFFGDLHTHSIFSDSRVPAYPEDLLKYGREVALLDFMAITDHSEGVFGPPLSEQEFSDTAKALKNAYAPDSFTTLLGFEWTSTFRNEASPWGHRSVIYPGLWGSPIRSDLPQTDTPAELYQKTGSVFSFPHHTMMPWGAFRWNQKLLPFFEKGVEIFSAHGTSEEVDLNGRMQHQVSEGAIQEAVAKRFPLKIMASSDTHAGHPGLNDWKGKIMPGLLDGGGLIAVFASSNTRETIFHALTTQSFYATSGPKILLYPKSKTALFPLNIHGTDDLEKVEIFEFLEGGERPVRVIELQDLDAKIEHTVHKQAYAYYVRVTQRDSERAWIGPIYKLPASSLRRRPK